MGMYLNGYFYPNFLVDNNNYFNMINYTNNNSQIQYPNNSYINFNNQIIHFDPLEFKSQNPNINLLPCIEIERKYRIFTPIGYVYGFYNNSSNFLGSNQFFGHFIVDESIKDDNNDIVTVYPVFSQNVFHLEFVFEDRVITKYGYIMRQIFNHPHNISLFPFNSFFEIDITQNTNPNITKYIINKPILHKYVFLSNLYYGYIFNYSGNMVFIPLCNSDNLFYFENDYKKLIIDINSNYNTWNNIFKNFYNKIMNEDKLNIYKKNIKEYKYENNKFTCNVVESPIMTICNTNAIKEYSDYLCSFTQKYINFKEFIVGNVEWIFDLFLNTIDDNNILIIDNYILDLIKNIEEYDNINNNFVDINDNIKKSFVLDTDIVYNNKYIIRKTGISNNIAYQIYVNYDNKYLHNILFLNVNLPITDIDYCKFNDSYIVNQMENIFERCFNMIRIAIFDFNSICKLKDNILQLNHFNYILTTFQLLQTKNIYNENCYLTFDSYKIKNIMDKINRLTSKLNYLKIYDLTSDDYIKEQFNILEKNNELDKFKKTLELFIDYGIDCSIPTLGYIQDIDFLMNDFLSKHYLLA